MKIRYIGSGTNPASYQEYPVTGVNALWQPEQVSDVSDARANALVASGRLLAAAGTTEHIVSVKFVDITTSVQQWLIARAVDGSNYWRVGITTPTASGNQTLALQNIVSGAVGTINKAIGQMVRGDTVAIEAAGALLRIYVNGVPIHEEPCITSIAGSSFGIQANAGANTFYRNLTCIRSDQ